MYDEPALDKIVTLGATPKAILVSGGGDDLAGKESESQWTTVAFQA